MLDILVSPAKVFESSFGHNNADVQAYINSNTYMSTEPVYMKGSSDRVAHIGYGSATINDCDCRIEAERNGT